MQKDLQKETNHDKEERVAKNIFPVMLDNNIDQIYFLKTKQNH